MSASVPVPSGLRTCTGITETPVYATPAMPPSFALAAAIVAMCVP